MKTPGGEDILVFKTAKQWQEWLDKHHGDQPRIWLQFFKKDSGIRGLTYAEALDEALCYGWIDGLVKGYDEKSWIQSFTPRRKRSVWSKRNIDHITRLTKLGKMKPAGLKEVEAAKADGRWDQAYDSQANMVVPDDFLKELAKNKTAKEFFNSLNKTNVYAICYQLQTAKKPETRERRIEKFIAMLGRQEKLY